MPGEVPDEQMGQIISAIVLPEAWLDRVLAQVHGADEVKRVERERDQVQQRLKRLGTAYVDGMYDDAEYRRQKRVLDDKLQSLVVPDADVAAEAGKLLEHLPELWGEADLAERRRILLTMLDAVYVDTVDKRRIVAIRPRPAFRPLLEIATMRAGSGIVLVHDRAGAPETQDQPPPGGQEADDSCSWWRRGRVEAHREHGIPVLLAAKRVRLRPSPVSPLGENELWPRLIARALMASRSTGSRRGSRWPWPHRAYHWPVLR